MPHRSPYLGLLVVVAASLAGRPLHAQEAAPAEPPPGPSAPPSTPAAASDQGPTPPPPLAPTPLGKPTIDLHVGEPAPVVARHVHLHDGFYLRSSVGLVTARTFVTSDALAHPSYSVSGGGLALDLMVGGSPSVGLALGGALSLQSFGHGGGSSAGLGLLGAFVDGFPMANKGLHLGGMLGLAGSRTSRKGGVDELRARGLGMSAWLGHDWWVADEWSMGGLVRFSGALTKDGSHDEGPAPYSLESSTYELGLLFSVLYH